MDKAAPQTRGNVEGRLAGKVALITGIGSGQGQAAALLFARAGARVVGADISKERLDETLALARAENLAVEGTVFDATDEDAVQKWADDAAAAHGGIDVLYNNAAHAHFGAFPDVTLDQWRQTLQYELDIVFLPSRAVWPHMVARGGGSIINIASGLGMRGVPVVGGVGNTPHAAGKGGVIGFTNQLACEGAPHWIRANAISPGPIVTSAAVALMETNPEFRKVFEGVTLLGRPGVPDDVVYASLFLASDESVFITGANIPVDGGINCSIGLSFTYQP